jgi:hypothetical protein
LHGARLTPKRLPLLMQEVQSHKLPLTRGQQHEQQRGQK